MFSNSKNKFSQFFKKNGFVIINIFNSKDIEILKNKIKYKSAKIAKIRKKWDLSQYHKFINSNQNKKITKNSKRFICVNREIINKISKSKIIKDILNNIWGHSNFIVPNQNTMVVVNNDGYAPLRSSFRCTDEKSGFIIFYHLSSPHTAYHYTKHARTPNQTLVVNSLQAQ